MRVLPLPLPKLTSASFSTTRRQINKHDAVKYKLEYFPTHAGIGIGGVLEGGYWYWKVLEGSCFISQFHSCCGVFECLGIL